MRTQTAQSLDLLLARSTLYRLLASVLLYPSQEIAPNLLSAEWSQLLKQALRRLVRDSSFLQEGARLIREQALQIDFDRWQEEYLRVFGHTIPKDCPPYETQYGHPHLFMQAQQLAQLAAFYEAFGLLPSNTTKERSDHIAVELEFMGYLVYRQAYALSEGHSEEQTALLTKAQIRFLETHLGRFGRTFARLLQKKATAVGSAFYQKVGQMLESFLTVELQSLGLEPKEWMEAHLSPFDDSEPGDFRCGISTQVSPV